MLTTTETILAVFMAILCTAGLAFTIISGVRAWRGTWRSWAASQATTPIPKFGKYSYAGLFGFYLIPPLLAVVALCIVSPWVPTPHAYNMFILGVVMPLSIPLMMIPFRLPRFLLPRWYNEWMDRGARVEEVDTPEYSGVLR